MDTTILEPEINGTTDALAHKDHMATYSIDEVPLMNVSHTLEQLDHNMTMIVLPVTVIIGIESVIGIIGNLLVLLAYSRHIARSNFRYFVLSMAACDLTSCLTTIPGEIFAHLHWYSYEQEWICKIKSYFNVFTVWGSASILLLLAFDRYRKICKPLQWQIRPYWARNLSCIFIFVSAIVSAPVTILWGTRRYQYNHEGVLINVTICEKTTKYADGIYPIIYIGSVYVIPLGLMICVVCSLNTLIARQLFRRRKSLIKRQLKGNKFRSDTSLSTYSLATDTVSLDNVFPALPTESSPKGFRLGRSKSEYHKLDKGKDKRHSEHEAGLKPCPVCDGVKPEPVCFHTDVSFTTAQNDSQINSVTFSTDLEIHVSDGVIRDKGNRRTSLISTARAKSLFTRAATSIRGKTRGKVKDISNKYDLMRRKTIIMLVLTMVFISTMALYVILTCILASANDIPKEFTNSQKTWYFFFWRLYFINVIINPILYGFMDPRFRAGLQSFCR